MRPLPWDRRGPERATDRPPATAASLRRKCARDVLETVHEGRLSKGMPAWKDVLTDEVINDVYAYLITVQTPAGSTN